MRRLIPLLPAVLLLAGCDAILFPENTPDPGLKGFVSEQEFDEYVRDQVGQRNTLYLDGRGGSWLNADDGDFGDSAGGLNGIGSEAPTAGSETDPIPQAPQDGGTNVDEEGYFSQTTTQEEGVDEADVVKTDGTYVYLIRNQQLLIARINPPENLAEIGAVSLEGYGRELYLHGTRVVALTETYGGWYGGVVGVDVDVDDTGSPGVAENPAASAEANDGEEEPPSDGDRDDDGAQTPGDEGAGDGGDNANSPDDDDPTDPGDDAGSPGDDADAPDGAGDGPDDPKPDEGDEEPVEGEPVDQRPDEGDVEPEPYAYEPPQTLATIIDVSDPTAPRIVSTFSFDGWASSSRMIDGRLHLVLANQSDYCYPVIPFWGEPELDVAEVEPEAVLPTYRHINAAGEVSEGKTVTWAELYRPNDPDGFGTLTVISLDVEDGSTFEAVGVMADPALIYSSIDSLYVTDSEWGYNGDARQYTSIYKFVYTDGAAVPVAAGSVPGRVLNQYSMSEYDGSLRVATTVDATWFFGRSDEPYNNVYVLQQQADELNVVGSLENLATGETIQSARFVGAKGFLVTFEQIDPLFTLDLSDPTNPQVVGELKVPGFSTFMVPMDENHVLAFGEYVPEDGNTWITGVQLSVFDVTDFSNPIQEHNVILGGDDEDGYSEALWNPKALTFFSDTNGNTLIAFPLTLYAADYWWSGIEEPAVDPGVIGGDDADDNEGFDEAGSDDDAPVTDDDEPGGFVEPVNDNQFQGLAVYRVSVDAGFSEVGRISTTIDPDCYWCTSFTRGLFIDDVVWAVTDQGIRGGLLDSLSSLPYELVFTQGE